MRNHSRFMFIHDQHIDRRGKLIGNHDLSKFHTLFLAGERGDPPTVQWAEEHLNVPVIDHWWQTETGWAIAGNPVGLGMLPVKHGSPPNRAGLEEMSGVGRVMRDSWTLQLS